MESTSRKADELRGTKADTIIYYDTDDFLVILSQEESTISLITKKGIFNTGGRRSILQP